MIRWHQTASGQSPSNLNTYSNNNNSNPNNTVDCVGTSNSNNTLHCEAMVKTLPGPWTMSFQPDPDPLMTACQQLPGTG